MSIVLEEIQDIRDNCEAVIQGSRVITCVPSLIQVSISKTKFKQVVACMQFPASYPQEPLLVELKSHFLSEKILKGLSRLCDVECKNNLGNSQVMGVLRLLSNFLETNPLCICSEEISSLKQILQSKDEVKLKQKSSSVHLMVFKDKYFLKLSAIIPHLYPDERISLDMKECNFPDTFQKWFLCQANEIARRHVEKPLRIHPKDPPFQPKPSLLPALSFLVREVKRYPTELCPLCKELCFPEDPCACTNEASDKRHIERTYCGHVFHNECLDTFMKTPPFSGCKRCPQCKMKIFHDKWKMAPELVEDRWAHQEAKKRELGEVVEFFQ